MASGRLVAVRFASLSFLDHQGYRTGTQRKVGQLDIRIRTEFRAAAMGLDERIAAAHGTLAFSTSPIDGRAIGWALIFDPPPPYVAALCPVGGTTAAPALAHLPEQKLLHRL